MVRSAPPPNVSLPEVTTAPLTTASAATLSTSASSSAMTEVSITFIDLPGISQVISAMPSASTSNLKLDISYLLESTSRSVRRAVCMQDADGLAVALEFQVRARIMRALGRCARTDLEQQYVRLGAVHDAVAVRRVRLPAGAVAGLEDRLATLALDQHALAS